MKQQLASMNKRRNLDRNQTEEDKTTVRFDKAMLKQLRHLAIEQETSLNFQIITAVREYLNRHKRNGKSSSSSNSNNIYNGVS